MNYEITFNNRKAKRPLEMKDEYIFIFEYIYIFFIFETKFSMKRKITIMLSE